MIMRKIIILHLIFCFFCLQVLAIDNEPPRVEALKKQLSFSHGGDKLEILVTIARAYIESSVVRSDSGIVYARQACELARELNDREHLCIAYSQYAKVLLQASNPNEGLIYYRLTAQLAHEMKNDSLEALGIRGVGQALWYQGSFQQAIDTIIASIHYFKRLGYAREISDATVIISSIYGNEGNYEKAFEFAQEALRLSMSLEDTSNIVLSLVQMGYLYKNIGDYSTALEYYRKGYSFNPQKNHWSYRYLCICMGELFSELQQYDSARYFYQQSFNGNPRSKASALRLAKFYLAQNVNDSALYYFTGLYNSLKYGGERHIFMYTLLGMGQVYLNTKNYAKALHYGQSTLAMARQKNAKLTIRDACQLLSSVYNEMDQPGRAFFYYKQYVEMKDSVVTDQFKGKLYEFKRIAEDERKQARIKLLEKEKFISEQKLKSNKLIRNILFAAIFLIGLFSIIIVWSISLKRKNEKLQNESMRTEWQRAAADLEMQALRARMNPHFIFNCLSSINRFILKNKPDKASDYLTRFSRLIRLVLINSQKQLITLEEEMEMLRLYIDMERLRFKNSFDYSITYTNDVALSHILIPPLLLQPFCENAIWHGLMHKEGQGHLSIRFNMDRDILNCSITDDGIGREKAVEIKSRAGERQKSLGLKLTAARLALFNEGSSIHTSYEMEDVEDAAGNIAGTRVILKIRYKEFIEETI